MNWEERLARICDTIDVLAADIKAIRVKWAPDDVRNPGPPFSNSLPPSPVLPPVVTTPTPVDVNRYATLGGNLTDELPFNEGSGNGAHVEVRNGARLRIVVPHGYVGRKELEVSHIVPGQPDRVKLSINGVELQVPFGGGAAKMPSGDNPLFVYGLTYILDVDVFPVGFGCSLQLR